MKKVFLFWFFLFTTSISFAQTTEPNQHKIDILLSKNIIKNTELEKVKFINDMSVSETQTLVLASSKCFYSIGYGRYSVHPVNGKSISSFCIIDNDVYFSDRSILYKIGSDNKETLFKRLPFSPLHLWAGDRTIYAVSKSGKTYRLYAIFPEKKIHMEFYTTTKNIIGVAEYGPLIFILTPESLITINIKEKTFSEYSINLKTIGRAKSMAVDKGSGDLYISSNMGVFRSHQGELQKVCADKGVLCYDIDGMLIFDNKAPFLFRLRNNLLYSKPIPKGVVIDIR